MSYPTPFKLKRWTVLSNTSILCSIENITSYDVERDEQGNITKVSCDECTPIQCGQVVLIADHVYLIVHVTDIQKTDVFDELNNLQPFFNIALTIEVTEQEPPTVVPMEST